MKKIFIILNVLNVFLQFSCSSDYNSKKFIPLESQVVDEIVYVVNDGGISKVNMYLIKNDEKYIAIDAGCYRVGVKKELEKFNINPDNVEALFLTHADGDHTASVDLFKNAKIYISKEEEKHFSGEKFRIYTNKPNYVYQTLKDEETITVSNMQVKCFLTPGHSEGSTTFLVNDAYLFAGDTISLVNGKIETFVESYNSDTEKQKESVKKISSIKNIKYIFTGHHGLLKF